MRQRAPPLRTGHRGKSRRAVGVGGPALTPCSTPHPTGNDREVKREREMDAVRRHSQSTWPVSMRPLHAGTQEERVGGKKQEAHKQTADGKSTATASPRPETPHQPSHTHHRSAASPWARKDSALHTTISHTPPAVNHRGQEREETHRHRLQFSPTANGIQPQPTANTQRTRSE
ncbi:hypothetical protein TcCL_Unassigned03169 [Trypanosoma cruzi]|nr:hypothetical protein TcCL_Unassigned03169 [Trypanosoma cruzi]